VTTLAPRWIRLAALAACFALPIPALAAEVVRMGDLPAITNAGLYMAEAFQLLDTKQVFAGVVTFGLLGVASTWLLQWLERVGCPWIQRSN